jgi:hypothetical protein
MYGPFQIEVVEMIMCGGGRGWGGEIEYLQCAVVASCSKVFVGRVKTDTLDMTLVERDSLELLKGIPRPDDDFRIQAH